MTIATSEKANSEQPEEPVPLFFGPQTESLELLADGPALFTSSDDVAACSSQDGADVAHVHSLVGHWSGGFAYDSIDSQVALPHVSLWFWTVVRWARKPESVCTTPLQPTCSSGTSEGPKDLR